MYLKNVDGKPIFATRLVKINSSDIEKVISSKQNLGISVEHNGDIVCYSVEESIRISEFLKSLGIGYNLSVLNDSLADEVDNIKYLNRSEIIEQLQKNKVPKAKEESDLRKRVDNLEKQVKLLTIFMDSLKAK